MNPRVVTALILAPIACALVLGAWLSLGLRRPESSEPGLTIAALAPGLMYGALFEVFALLPLFLLLKRAHMASRLALVGFGTLLWGAAVALNLSLIHI